MLGRTNPIRSTILVALALVALLVALLLALRTSRELRGAKPRSASGAAAVGANLSGDDERRPRETAGIATSESGAAQTSAPRTDAVILLGRVVDATTNPIPSVSLVLRAEGERWAEGVEWPVVRREVRTFVEKRFQCDAEGRFRFEVPMPSVSYVCLTTESPPLLGIGIRCFDTTGTSNAPPLRAGENDVGDIVLAACGSLSGTVLTEDRVPIADATLFTSIDLGDGFDQARFRTDRDGRFQIDHLPGGLLDLHVRADGFVRGERSGIEVKSGAMTANVDFVLERAPTITGRVLDERGSPVEGLEIQGWPVRSGTWTHPVSSKDGSFTASLPSPGPYTFLVLDPRFDPWESSGAFEPGTTGVEIRLRKLPVITFVVVDDRTGTPIERYGIEIYKRVTPLDSIFFEAAKTEGHARGEFAFPANPERNDVRVEVSGFAPVATPVSPDADNRQTIRMRPGGTIVGRVTLRDTPLASCAVRIERCGIKIDPTKPDESDDIMRL